MKTTRTRTVLALVALSALSACDYAAKKDLADERESRLYRSAMADYKAGRIDAAVDGFEKTVRAEPGNAGARFQFACLLQDSKKDPLGAYCAYHEYILQHPKSDKSKVASDRMAICEKEVATILAKRHGLLSNEGLLKEIEVMKSQAAEMRTRIEAADKEIAQARARISALTAERGRLVAAISDVGASVDQTPRPPSVKEAKELLEAEDEGGDRRSVANDVAKLRAEEKDELESGTSLLPAQTKEDFARRDAAEAAKKARDEALRNKPPSHPPTYVVQEGDTLYRIAVRFYGHLSAWKMIRDANKALISNDGRVRAGDTIVLPGQ